MNYFAHGYRLVDRPWILAGTALPDWLGASNRRARLRRRRIEDGGDPRAQELAQGVLRHLEDDAWFHATEAFQRTWVEIAELVDPAFDGKGWFVAHVLLEMLLDGALIEQMPERLAAYYAAIDEIDPRRVEAIASRWTARPPTGLAEYVEAFRRHRFLYGYREDEGICARLSRVNERVGLPPLPAEFAWILPEARGILRHRAEDLLCRPEG